jgi:hypothetical protein
LLRFPGVTKFMSFVIKCIYLLCSFLMIEHSPFYVV